MGKRARFYSTRPPNSWRSQPRSRDGGDRPLPPLRPDKRRSGKQKVSGVCSGLDKNMLIRRFLSSGQSPLSVGGVTFKPLGFGHVMLAQLEAGASMKSRIGSCVGRSSSVKVEPVIDGVFSAISRRMTGAPFFLEKHSANAESPAELFISPRGWDVAVAYLDGSNEFIMRGEAFTACSANVRLSTCKLPKEFLSDTGMLGLNLRGHGLIALAGYGKLHRIELEPGMEYVFNRRNLIAWSDSVEIVPLNPMTKWSILLSKNIFNKERLTQALAAWSTRKARYCTLKGPGVVFMSAHVEHRPRLIERSKLTNKASPEELDYQTLLDSLTAEKIAAIRHKQQEQASAATTAATPPPTEAAPKASP